MNERQRRFCEHYAANPNATAAAMAAGYSARTARSQGQRMLTNADILAYILELQETQRDTRILTIEEVRAFWSGVINDTSASMQNRLKASELLARSGGAFIHIQRADGSITAGSDGGDVCIYLPAIEREEDCLYTELD